MINDNSQEVELKVDEAIMPRKSKSFDNLGLKFMVDLQTQNETKPLQSPQKDELKPPITSKILKLIKTPFNPKKQEVTLNQKKPDAFLKIRKNMMNPEEAKSFLNTSSQVYSSLFLIRTHQRNVSRRNQSIDEQIKKAQENIQQNENGRTETETTSQPQQISHCFKQDSYSINLQTKEQISRNLEFQAFLDEKLKHTQKKDTVPLVKQEIIKGPTDVNEFQSLSNQPSIGKLKKRIRIKSAYGTLRRRTSSIFELQKTLVPRITAQLDSNIPFQSEFGTVTSSTLNQNSRAQTAKGQRGKRIHNQPSTTFTSKKSFSNGSQSFFENLEKQRLRLDYFIQNSSKSRFNHTMIGDESKDLERNVSRNMLNVSHNTHRRQGSLALNSTLKKRMNIMKSVYQQQLCNKSPNYIDKQVKVKQIIQRRVSCIDEDAYKM